MKKWFRNLKFIFMPRFWIMNNPYSKGLDEKIRFAIANDLVKLLNGGYGDYYCSIYGHEVWISNFPYASGTLNGSRASRQTIIDLNDHVMRLRLSPDSV